MNFEEDHIKRTNVEDLEPISSFCVKPIYVENDGSILVEILDGEDIDRRIEGYIYSNGFCLNMDTLKSLHKEQVREFYLGHDTLAHLSALVCAFRVGFNAGHDSATGSLKEQYVRERQVDCNLCIYRSELNHRPIGETCRLCMFRKESGGGRDNFEPEKEGGDQ